MDGLPHARQSMMITQYDPVLDGMVLPVHMGEGSL